MRISDWSSDVCSSDLARLIERMASESVALLSDAGTPLISDPGYKLVRDARAPARRITTLPGPSAALAARTWSGLPADRRSDERRVGKECFSTCRSRWSRYH